MSEKNERVQSNEKVLTYLGFAARSKSLIIGKDMLREYITNPRIKNKVIIVAKDAGDRVKRDLKIRCEMNNVKCIENFNKSELSKAIGRERVSAIGILDENLVAGILKALSE